MGGGIQPAAAVFNTATQKKDSGWLSGEDHELVSQLLALEH